MTCQHEGYRTISSSFDRERGLLVYLWSCERCGARLDEASRHSYRPNFDPLGNKPFLRSP